MDKNECIHGSLCYVNPFLYIENFFSKTFFQEYVSDDKLTMCNQYADCPLPRCTGRPLPVFVGAGRNTQ
uniref:Uncharacterized protein n=1 Tax=Anguilla anguilla TaxID=7936 RepID=A0A0E9RHR4_ANGAN